MNMHLLSNKIAFPSKDTQTRSCSCDLDLEPMTLIYELDSDILNRTCESKMNFLVQSFQKLQHYRQTQRDAAFTPGPLLMSGMLKTYVQLLELSSEMTWYETCVTLMLTSVVSLKLLMKICSNAKSVYVRFM